MERTLEKTPLHVFRPLFSALLICLSISGCGSSSKDNPAVDVVVDDSVPLGSPVSGTLNDDSPSTELGFTIAEDTVLDGMFAAFGASASEEFTIVSLPESGELTLRSEGSLFRYVPEPDYNGVDSFTYVTADASEIAVTITVTSVPDAPVFDMEIPQTANQGKVFSAILTGSDADGDSLRFSAENLPDWLELDADTGLLTGVPRQTDIGLTQPFVLMINDGTGLSDVIDDLQLDVIDINDPPSLNVAQVPRQLFGGEEFIFNVFPDDRDADSVSVSVEPHPAFETSVEQGRITLQMKDINLAGASEITILGRDDRGAVGREIVPVFLYPRTASGKGTTVSGVMRGKGVHVIILGDGYAADQQQAFERHVDNTLSYIRADEGIEGHLDAFNIHMINTVSQQSGADDSDTRDIVNTAFDSTYNCRSIPRLVCADTFKMYEAALAEYTEVDQIILLVNDIRYGGSGSSNGKVAVTSAFHPEIALHEMGHSLANLADEYVDPLIPETSGALPFEEGDFDNVSLFSDPSQVPWAHWIDPDAPLSQSASDSGVGIFEGGFYRPTGVYRATANSRMRDYNQPFGPVNTERWVLRLYTITDGFRELSPMAESLQSASGETVSFSVTPIFRPEVQKIVWSLNGEELTVLEGGIPLSEPGSPTDLADNIGEGLPKVVELQGGGALEALTNVNLTSIDLMLPPGRHQLQLTLSDISGRIRISPPHVGIFEKQWRINVQ